jgi:glycosyltransferase involved in cell wall biosynthesis
VRLAFFSPLPPAPTGIADYSADVLRELAPHHTIDTFPDGASFRKLDGRPYDLTVYQMGNGPAHLYMYAAMARTSGLLVLHELVLHHARAKAFLDSREARDYAAHPGSHARRIAAQERTDEYVAELTYSYPGKGWALAATQMGTTGDLLPYAYPLFRLPVESARLVACHSAAMVAAVEEEVPDAQAVRIPMMMTATPVPKDAVRQRRAALGFGESEVVVASFGLLTREKRIETVARAVARARVQVPRVRLLLVGDTPDRAALDRTLERLGLAGPAVVTGRVPFEDLPVLIEAADVVAHLRYPTGRETSAALLRVLAQGRPAVVSDLAHMADIPEDAVVRASVDDEEGELTRAILRLADDPERRRRLGERAAAFVADAHAPARCREAYLDAIERAAATPPPPERPWPPHWAAMRG